MDKEPQVTEAMIEAGVTEALEWSSDDVDRPAFVRSIYLAMQAARPTDEAARIPEPARCTCGEQGSGPDPLHHPACPVAALSTPVSPSVVCRHEPYQGKCAHCDIPFKDGRPLAAVTLEGKEKDNTNSQQTD